MAVYPRAHLIEHTRRLARRHVYQARYWRQEACAPLSYYTPRQCRDYARKELQLAGAYRRRSLVFLHEPGRYVTKQRHDQIMKGQW
jgi:hypothetical protein